MQKANRIRNWDAIAEGKRRYRAANPEKHKVWEERRKPKKLEYMVGYYERNKEARKAYQRVNRDRERELARKRYAENPTAKRAGAVAWAKANPEKAAEIRRTRRARVGNAPTIPFTPEQLTQRLAYYGHECWVCAGPADQIDHVKPITRGGWHALCNLRPICRSCNASKGARWPVITSVKAIRASRRAA